MDSGFPETVQANARTAWYARCRVSTSSTVPDAPATPTWWNRGVTSTVVRTARLTDDQQSAVLALVRPRRRSTDGVAPMSEQSLLAARGRSGRPVEHLLAYAGERARRVPPARRGGWRPRPAELVVAPATPSPGRRARELVGPGTGRGTRIWAHGRPRRRPRRFAAARGLEVVRELFVLGRRFDEAGPVRRAGPARRARRRAPSAGARRGGVAAGQRRGVRAPPRAGPADPRRPRRAHGGVLVRPRGADPRRCPQDDPDTVARVPLDQASRPRGAHDRPRRGAAGRCTWSAVDPAYQGRGLGRPVTLLGLAAPGRDQGVARRHPLRRRRQPGGPKVYRGLGFTTRRWTAMYASRA